MMLSIIPNKIIINSLKSFKYPKLLCPRKVIKFRGLYLKYLKLGFPCWRKGLSHVKMFPKRSWKSGEESVREVEIIF